MFDFLTSTKRPAAGAPVLSGAQVLERLNVLNHDAAPWRIVDGASEGVDLVAEWKILDPAWYEVFAKAGLTTAFKILLKLDEHKKHVRAQDRQYDVSWDTGVPVLSACVSKGQGAQFQYSSSYALKKGLSFEKEYEYSFNTSEIKKPVQAAVVACGWVYKGVMFGWVFEGFSFGFGEP
jgi:hypothetical protein